MTQGLLGALALADVGSDAAHARHLSAGIADGKLGGQVDIGAVPPEDPFLHLDGAALADHLQVVALQGIGDGSGKQLVIVAADHLVGGDMEQAFEGRVDQAVAPFEVLDEDHRAAVVDDLPQRILRCRPGAVAHGAPRSRLSGLWAV
jgi:hypothetical protein